MNLRQKLNKVNLSANSEKQKIDHAAKELFQIIGSLSPDDLFDKAFRHLIDGLLYRTVRHDFDAMPSGTVKKTASTSYSGFILNVWTIQNSAIWNDFLLFLGWVYIFMSFFEPTNRNDSPLD